MIAWVNLHLGDAIPAGTSIRYEESEGFAHFSFEERIGQTTFTVSRKVEVPPEVKRVGEWDDKNLLSIVVPELRRICFRVFPNMEQLQRNWGPNEESLWGKPWE